MQSLKLKFIRYGWSLFNIKWHNSNSLLQFLSCPHVLSLVWYWLYWFTGPVLICTGPVTDNTGPVTFYTYPVTTSTVVYRWVYYRYQFIFLQYFSGVFHSSPCFAQALVLGPQAPMAINVNNTGPILFLEPCHPCGLYLKLKVSAFFFIEANLFLSA